LAPPPLYQKRKEKEGVENRENLGGTMQTRSNITVIV
jgi:hypothetical protein